METITVPLWAALQVAKWRKRAIPRWKQWRLRNPEKDKEQRRGYYWRNRDKIAVNSHMRYWMRKGANAGDLTNLGGFNGLWVGPVYPFHGYFLINRAENDRKFGNLNYPRLD